MNRAVFLDRDGVINRVVVRAGRPHPPDTVETLEILPGVPHALRALRHAGFRLIVVTNQPDVGAGRQQREVVEAIHQRLRSTLPVDDIKVCYHVDEDGCPCRKPKPGLLVAAATEWALSLPKSFMIGDRWRDVDAGRAAGCKTILVRAAYDERPAARPDAIVDSLLEASGLIVAGRI